MPAPTQSSELPSGHDTIPIGYRPFAFVSLMDEVADVFVKTSRGWVPVGPEGVQGPTGPVGARGLIGSTGIQGPPGAAGGMNWRGVWSSSGTYVEKDVVSYNSKLYYMPGMAAIGVPPDVNPNSAVFTLPGHSPRNFKYVGINPEPFSVTADTEAGSDYFYFDVMTVGTVLFKLTHAKNGMIMDFYNTAGVTIGGAEVLSHNVVLDRGANSNYSTGRKYLKIRRWTDSAAFPQNGTIVLSGTATLAPLGAYNAWEPMT